jgi:hypothetical protein
LIPLFAWRLTGAKKEKAFRKAFKGEVVALQLQDAFAEVNYQSDTGFTKEFIDGLGVFRGFDKAQGSDFLRAEYRGRPFTSADVSLIVVEEYEDTDSDGDTVIRHRDVAVFRGSIVVLERPSSSLARLLICARGLDHAVNIPRRGETQDMAIFGSGSGKPLDSLQFKREFGVTCDDSEKGHAMLTPLRIEGLRKLDESIPGRFAVLYESKKLYLIVSGENAFEVHLGKKAASVQEQQKRVADEVKRLTGRLDLLLAME